MMFSHSTPIKAVVTPLLGLTLLVTACAEEESPTSITSTAASEAKPIPVHTAKLETTSFDDQLNTVARLEAKTRARIAAEVPGRIESVPVDEGSVVKKGGRLVRINGRIAAAQVAQAKAGLAVVDVSYNRVKKLVAKNLSTRSELDMLEAQRAQAEAGLALARANYEKAVITAPFSGQTTNVGAVAGAYASPGAPLMELVDLSWVKVLMPVAERDLPFVKVNTQVEVGIQAFPGERFEGVVAKVGLTANGATRTFGVVVYVQNTEGRLRPGMMANVILPLRSLDDALVIPRDAVRDEPDQKVVFVEENGIAKERTITLGATRGSYALVRSGLKAGEKLIVLGHRQVVDGQRVSVKKSEDCCKKQTAKLSNTSAEDAAAPKE